MKIIIIILAIGLLAFMVYKINADSISVATVAAHPANVVNPPVPVVTTGITQNPLGISQANAGTGKG